VREDHIAGVLLVALPVALALMACVVLGLMR
jgi:hypothetical protein